MSEWGKATEFVPSWYKKTDGGDGGAKKDEAKNPAPAAAATTAADAPKPKPAAKKQNNNQKEKKEGEGQQQSSGNRLAAGAAGSAAGLNANATAFVMPPAGTRPPPPNYQQDSSSSAAIPQQKQSGKPKHSAKDKDHQQSSKKDDSTPASSSSAATAPAAATSSSTTSKHAPTPGGKEQAGSKRQNPKPKKPPAPHQQTQQGKKAAVSPHMGGATGSWVTPPLAAAPAPGGKKGGGGYGKNGGSSNSGGGGGGGAGELPAMDLGSSAVSDESNKAAISTAIESLGVKHTQKDVERIVAKTKMSSAAVAFMPAGFVPKARPAVQPVSVPKNMPSVAPVVPDDNRSDLSLLDTWILYFDDMVKKSEEEFDPYLICHMTDIPTFWRVFQNVPPVSRQNDNTNYYLFREGVMPKWEDPRNDGGGAWTLKFQLTRSSEVIDATWERLACQVLGENWSEDIRPTINGIVAKIRPRSISFQIWVSKRIDSILSQLADRALSTTIAAAMWDYFPHPKPGTGAPASPASPAATGAGAAAAVSGASSSASGMPSAAGSSVGSREGSQTKS